MHATSPYLKQHAHNPVDWYPWGPEALARARSENKPIHLSIGYSACYWCHVMERNVFENPSIAELMNRMCVNIKIDREEHPQLDEIYMVARQLLTHEGGWPNTLFLTPDLKPFYAGGTFAPDDSYGKTPFPRLLEWLDYVWTTQEEEARRIADRVVEDMGPLLVTPVLASPPPARGRSGGGPELEDDSLGPPPRPSPLQGEGADTLFKVLSQFHDARSGGFFQAPKFPHESYLGFLFRYHEARGSEEALAMVVDSLRKMAAGGIYDQVGCGFHRYAVDKEWYVPHFEKMLYNQAQLARLYTEAARLTSNPYLADIAHSILQFTGGPLASGNGAFYSAIDAETDGVEGAYYAWSAQEFEAFLTPQEITFLTTFYALADIPHFPGHKKVDGQVLILRKPLDDAARERQMPYVELAAMCGQVMNKLLLRRNTRAAPRLDDKAIVSWNGLMIDAFAHAGQVFNRPDYTARAKKAADFLLEHAIDNSGGLHHVYAGNRAQLKAGLEDYAFLAKGLLGLCKASPDDAMLEAALSLMSRAEELFGDGERGYFSTESGEDILIRMKNCDDSATPNANAVMVENLLDLFEMTGERAHLEKARQVVEFFVGGERRMQVEHAGMIAAGLRCRMLAEGKVAARTSDRYANETYMLPDKYAPEDAVAASVVLFPRDAKAGAVCELLLTIEIKDGWHINAAKVNQPFLIPTSVDIQGAELLRLDMPEALTRDGLAVYEGLVVFTARIRLTGDSVRALLRFQACREGSCYAARDMVFFASSSAAQGAVGDLP